MAGKLDCLLNSGLKKSQVCGYSLKQINEIYLANFAEADSLGITVATPTGDTDSTTDIYTVTAVSGATKWYKFEPAKDTSSYNDDLVVGGNGSKYRTHSMTFSFNGKYSALVAEVLDELSLGKFIAVLKLTDGSGIMLGRLTGLEASAASSLSEAAADGQNGITVTLECNTVEPALPMSQDALDAVIATTRETNDGE